MGAKRKAQRKCKPYTGVLAKPLPFVPPELDKSRPPAWWSGLGNSTDDWVRAVSKIGCQHRREFFMRYVALFDHFGIPPAKSGAIKDLLASLLARHEDMSPNEDGRVCLSKIFEREGLDPDNPEAESALTLRLMLIHVPGFSEARDPWESRLRLQVADLAGLAMAVMVVGTSLAQTDSRATPSDLAIATTIRDRKKLAAIIGPKAASKTHEILNERGNKRKGNQGPISESNLRSLIRDIRTCHARVKDGTATARQWVLFFEAKPLAFDVLANWSRKSALKKRDALPTHLRKGRRHGP